MLEHFSMAIGACCRFKQVGGAACHEGYRSCFFRQIDPATGATQVVGRRVFDPADVYKKS